jgi:hypothetical protein
VDKERRMTEGRARRAVIALVLTSFLAGQAAPVMARNWTDFPLDPATRIGSGGAGGGQGPYDTHAVPEINGPGRVSTAGNVWMKTTNIGVLGNPFTAQSSDPSGQWPGPSGVEYLFFIGLWIAAKNPEAIDPALVRRVSHNTEWRPPSLLPEDKIYQTYDGQLNGAREVDDDGDRQVDEEFLNGKDDDFDGRIDEDYAAYSQLMYTCELRDDTDQAVNANFAEKHVPFGLLVQQSTLSFAVPGANDFAAADFKIINQSGHQLDSVYVGFFVEQDVGPTADDRYFSDDIPEPRVPQGDFPEIIPSSGDARYSTDPEAPCLTDTIHVRGFSVTDDDGDMSRTPGASSFLLLGHTTDPTGQKAPRRVGFRMYRFYTPGTPFVQGGTPTVDIERYEAMSSEVGIDPATGLINEERPEDTAKTDTQALCSVGPFLDFQNGENISVQIALAVQRCDYDRPANSPTNAALPNPERYEPMILNAIEAQKTYRGKFLPTSTGETPDQRGRETGVIAPPGQQFELSDCRDEEFGSARLVTSNETTWFDFDCNFCTGVPLHVSRKWLAAAPPPNPAVRLTAADRKIVIEWDNLSEITPDPSTGRLDYLKYRVWKASNFTRPVGSSGPSEELWALLAEFRIYDSLAPLRDSCAKVTSPQGTRDSICTTWPVLVNTQTLQRTFPVDIRPCKTGTTLVNGRCQNPDDPEGPELLAEPMLGDTAYVTGLRWYRDANNTPVEPDSGRNFRTAVYPVGRYRYEDPNVLNGFVYFYSVTGKDSTGVRDVQGGRGTLAEQEGRKSATEQQGISPQAQAAGREGGVYVVPNPYRGRSQWDLTPSATDPTGTHVDFFNLPPGQWTLRIFTISGDLVQTIRSSDQQVDGKLQQENSEDGQATWNLISRNGQDVVSGIYLFSVESTAGTEQGKFVIIR